MGQSTEKARSEKGKGKKNKKKKATRKKGLSAKQADLHELYERAVQNPAEDVKFLDRIFKKRHDRRPQSLKEDFCGTAWMCAEWVQSRSDRVAYGVDLDASTQEWGRLKHIEPLGDAAGRVTLLNENVLEVREPGVDCVVAFNFSYCVFLDRPGLCEYFKNAYDSLEADGCFAIDIHGGPESVEELEERTDHKDFTYVWDQTDFCPVTHRSIRKIHFEFPDGTKRKNAFIYNWRVWTMPELRDVMLEVGFREVEVYWEGFDKKGEGNGIFKRVETAENDASWIAYIVAWK